MNLKELEAKKQELEEKIESFEFPLYYAQVLQRDELIKQLKEVKFKIFILKNKKGR